MLVFVGIVPGLKPNQTERFSTLNHGKILGVQYEFESGKLFVNVKSELSEGEKQDLMHNVLALPDTKTEFEMNQERLKAIKSKSNLNLDEVVEALKIKGIL